MFAPPADAFGILRPDAKDGFSEFNDNLFLAHTRLKIIDLSDHANQPLKSPCGRYTLIYNGEIYNFKELKQILQKDGAQFHSNSDTEVILVAYEIWGIDKCLQMFEGMFAFAVFDFKKKGGQEQGGLALPALA